MKSSSVGWVGTITLLLLNLGCGSGSVQVDGTDTTIGLAAGFIPSVPGSLSAQAISSSEITLSWSDSNGEEGYNLERREAPNNFVRIATLDPDVITFSDGGLVSGHSYEYRVQAFRIDPQNVVLTSSYSNVAIASTLPTIPNAPANLLAVSVSSSQVHLTWNDMSSNEDGFDVERSTVSIGPFAPIGMTGANVHSLDDSGLSPGVTYYYQVRAHNSAGSSAYSNVAVVTMSGDTLAPVVSITNPVSGTMYNTAQTVVLTASATDNVGVTKVEFYDGAVLKSTASVAPYTHSWSINVSDNGVHAWTAKAYDSAGNSATSTPTNLTVNITDTIVPIVSISAPSSGTTYTSAQAVSITALATDNIGVTKVEFYDGAVLKSTDTSSPYSHSWSFTIADNGSHSWTALAYDAAGNTAASTPVLLTVNIPDTTAPAVSISSPASGTSYTSAQTVAINATASDNIGVSKVEFYDGAVLKSTDTTSPYSHSWSFTMADNGSHSWTAKAYDAAGNSTVSSAVALTVNIADTQAPTVSISSPASGTSYTSAQTVAINATASDNIGVSKVEFYDGAVLKSTDTSSPYSYSWSFTMVDNGSHSWTAKAYDAAGNNTASSAVALTVNIPDTTAPTVSISSPASGTTYTSAQSVAIDAVASDNIGVTKVEFYDGALLKSTDTTSPYSHSWSFTMADNGSHSWSAKAYDAAGNSTVSSAVALMVNIADTQAPTASISSPASGTSYTSAQTVSIDAAASDNIGVSKVEFYDGGVLKSTDTTSPYSHSWVFTIADNGSHSWTAKAYDAAGNNTVSSAITLTINIADTQAPTVSISSPASGTSYTSAQTVAINATASDNIGVSKVEFYDGGVLKSTDTTSPYSHSWSFTIADNGSHSWTAKAYDAAGNSTVSSAVALTVNIADTQAPIVSISSPNGGSTYTTAQTVAITATASDNVGVSKVEFYDGGVLKSTDTISPYSHSWSFTIADNATHNWTAKAYDAAGNNTVSSAVSLIVNIGDSTNPTVSISSPSSGSTFTSAQTVTISAVASDDVGVTKVEFYDGAILKSTDTASPYSHSWSFTNVDNGTHNWTAKAYDAAGNSATSAPINLIVNIADTTAPTVLISSPASGTSYTSAQTVSIDAAASDNIGVAKVEFYDGGVLKSTDTTSPYSHSWSFTIADNGSHSWTAKAYDAANNSTVSSVVALTVNIADTQAPTVSISSPATGTSYTSAQTVAINATASDNIGVTKVEFYDGAVLKSTDTTSPYSYSWSFTIADNGSHSWTAKAYDAANNSTVSSVVALTVNIADTQAPTVTISSPATGTSYTSAQTVAINATASDNIGVTKVEFYDGAVLKSTDTTSPYSHSWSFTIADNGSHSWTAKAYDAAGNSTVSSAVALMVNIADTQAPTASISSPASGTSYTSAQTVSIDAAASDNIGVSKVEFYDGGVLKSTDTTSPYSHSWVFTIADNGSHSWTAKAYDAAGNNTVSSAVALTVNIADTQAPTVTISSPATGTSYTSAQTVAINATASDNIGVTKVEFYDGAVLKSTDTTSPYSHSWSFTIADNGSHSWTAKAYDAAGNNTVSSAVSLTVNIPDTTAPTVSISSPASGTSYTSAQTVAINATASDNIGVSKVEFYDGALLKSTDTTSPYSHSWLFAIGDNGSHSWTAKAYDAAGNSTVSSAVALTVNIVDTTAPIVSISSPPSGTTYTSAQTVAINAAASDDIGVTRVEFYDGGVLKSTDTTSPYSYSWSFTIADNGSHSWTAKAYDAAGNSTVSSAVALTVNIVDTTAPIVSISSPPSGTTYTSAQTVTINATASDNIGVTKVEFYDGGVLKATDLTSPYSYAWSVSAAVNGVHSWTAKAYDSTNTTTSAAVSLTVDIDVTAPTVSISSPTSGTTYTTAQTVAINATASDNKGVTRVEFYDGATLKSTDTSSPYSYAWLIASADNGAHNWTAKAFDAAGNNSTSSIVILTVNITSAPTGAYIWSKQLGGSGSSDTATGNAVVADPSGNVVVAGVFGGSMNLGTTTLTSVGTAAKPDLFIAKYDPSGILQWAKNFGKYGTYPNNQMNSYVPVMGVDSSGNIFVAGNFFQQINFGSPCATLSEPTGSFVALYLVKLSPSGTCTWAKAFGSTDVEVGGLSVDSNGNVAITGHHNGAQDFGGGPIFGGGAIAIWMAKFQNDGTYVWSNSFPGSSVAYPNEVATDPSGNMIVSGIFAGTLNFGLGALTSNSGSQDIFIAKFSPTGVAQWSKKFGDSSEQFAEDIAIDSSGNIFITGEFSGTLDFSAGSDPNARMTNVSPEDIYLAKLHSDGSHYWSKQFSANPGLNGAGSAQAIAVDRSGNVLLTGALSDDVDFGGGALAGPGDIFIAKFDATAAHLWSKRFTGGDYYMAGNDIATDPSGNVFGTGEFIDNVNFGPTSSTQLVNVGGLNTEDGFLVKLAP